MATKTEIWNKTTELLTENSIEESSELFKALELLLRPKLGGNSTRPDDNENGETWCRYTGEYHNYDEMVYQNSKMKADKKHKGYSKEGIARWSKGAKWIKNEQVKAFDLAMDGDIKGAQIIKESIDKFDKNNPDDLAKFATIKENKKGEK